MPELLKSKEESQKNQTKTLAELWKTPQTCQLALKTKRWRKPSQERLESLLSDNYSREGIQGPSLFCGNISFDADQHTVSQALGESVTHPGSVCRPTMRMARLRASAMRPSLLSRRLVRIWNGAEIAGRRLEHLSRLIQSHDQQGKQSKLAIVVMNRTLGGALSVEPLRSRLRTHIHHKLADLPSVIVPPKKTAADRSTIKSQHTSRKRRPWVWTTGIIPVRQGCRRCERQTTRCRPSECQTMCSIKTMGSAVFGRRGLLFAGYYDYCSAARKCQ